MAQAPRHVCTVTVRKMVILVMEKLRMVVSRGSVASLRPFFVIFPCDRERLECLCATCFNIRQLFDAVMRHAKKQGCTVYESLTAYLTQEKTCHLHRNGYHSKDCITGKCSDCKGIVKPHTYPMTDKDTVTYYQFEKTQTGKVDSNGKPKTKTSRIDYNVVSVESCKEKLDQSGKKYMLHRFTVVHDKFIWLLVQHECFKIGEYIVHMDFSENIKEKPKKETQSHHFSGEQFSLHCAVKESPDDNVYFYHFSDLTKHDWQFLLTVLEDFLTKVFSSQNIIRLKSDNCSVQYKCADVFGMYLHMSMKLKKTIIVYYGAAGHGRGLVDGMSSFGVKTPLRKAIIASDFYWRTAAELVKLFHDNGMHSPTRQYMELTTESITSHTSVEGKKLPGCSKQHVIVFKANGKILQREEICDCSKCIMGNLDLCLYEKQNDKQNDDSELVEENQDDDQDQNDNSEENQDDEDDEEDRYDMFEIIQPGQIVALRTDDKDNRNYYLVVVNAIEEATSDMFDMHQHFVRKGQKYFSCNYLEIKKECRRYIQYVQKSSKVLVFPGEILTPFVSVGDDLKLSMDEHQWLLTLHANAEE